MIQRDEYFYLYFVTCLKPNFIPTKENLQATGNENCGFGRLGRQNLQIKETIRQSSR